MKFVLSIITVYLPELDEIVKPESIHQAPSISIEFFTTAVDQEAFHTQWYKKAIDVVCVQRAGNGIQ